jgi:iron complex transport system substrate-binding protein
MRICSLVPGATEIIAMLGVADALVGISHECDYPASIRGLPVMVQPAVDSDGMDSAEIDSRVKGLVSSGRSLYRINEQALREARPDLILAQDLCDVCAVTPHDLGQTLRSLSCRPRLLTLAPRSLGDVIDDVERIGAAIGLDSQASDLARSLRSRIAAIRDTSSGRPRPRVACLEWLNPLYVGGHWVPEMVEAAGGCDVLGHAGEPSRRVTMDEVRAAEPDIIILMPCGFSLGRTISELTVLCRTDPACASLLSSASKTYAVDAGSYFSRPGPRLVEGVELLADMCAGIPCSEGFSDSVRDLTGSLCLTGLSQ